MEAFGPWLLESVLGRGGMGVVWRARHGATGRLAAVKTVHLDTPSQIAGFGREIAALAGLSHPGIVGLLDHGVQDGRPWFAMELVEGVPLQAVSGTDTAFVPAGAMTFVDDLGPSAIVPLDTSSLRVLRALCPALAALHGAGLVHRDLKPNNVIVRPDGSPVLVDFGLAVVSRRREVLQVERVVAGTRGYMAPEQLRGELVDARADLYALGRMIEDAAADRPELMPLVAALVTDDPRDRIGHVDEVAAALDAVLGSEGPPVPSIPVLYRPALAGRSRERAELEEGLRGTGVVLVMGEPGSGKTRLVAEVLRPLVRAGATVVSQVTLADAGERLVRFAAAEADLAARGDRVVLVLDDLQWADELVVAFVEHLSTRPTPLCVVATARSGEATETVQRVVRGGAARVVTLGPLEDDAVAAIAEDMLATREIPPRWTPALATAGGSPLWVGEILRAALDERRLTRAGGRWRIDDFPIAADVQGWAARRIAALPEAVRDVVSAAAIVGRVADPDLLARMGVVATEGLREAVRRQILEDVGDRLLFAHDALRDAALAAVDPERRPLLFARAAEALGDDDPARVASLWAQAGDIARALPLFERAGDEATARGALLEAERAWREWIRLAEPAHARRGAVLHALGWKVLRRQGRHDEALAVATALLPLAEAAGDLELILNAMTTMGACHLNAGRPEAAAAQFEAVAERARDENPRHAAIALSNVGIALQAQGRYPEARIALLRSLRVCEELGDRRRIGTVQVELGSVAKAEGHLDEARQRYREAIVLLREAGERAFEAIALGNLGDAEIESGAIREGLAILEEALALKRELGDRRGEAYTIGSISIARARLGELAEAVRLNDVARALSVEVRDDRNLAELDFDRARFERDAGSPDEAARWFEAAHARMLAVGDRMHAALACAERARLAVARGEDPAPWLDEARATAEALGIVSGELADAIRAASESSFPLAEPPRRH